MSNRKELPHSHEAEQAYLGALLLNPDAIYETMDHATKDMFYYQQHGEIYAAIRTLANTGHDVNYVTIIDRLEQSGQLKQIGSRDMQGAAYITHLITSCPMAMTPWGYLNIIRRTWRLRRTIQNASTIVADAYADDADPDEVEAKALNLFAEASVENLSKIEPASVAADSALATIMDIREHPEKHAAWKSPWKTLTESPQAGSFKGLHPQDLIIVAARPGMGKTAFVVQWAHWLASQGVPGAIFSLEMTTYRLLCREAARITDIPNDLLIEAEFDNDAMPAVIQAFGQLKDLPIFYDDTAGLTLPMLKARLRYLALAKGIKWVIIDYLQLMLSQSGGKTTREREVAEISRGMKVLAKDLDLAIVATAQLNRGVEYRTDKRPGLADLRESGQLEQDADVVMFIYRDDYYNPDTEVPNIAEIILGKHRNGKAPITTPLYFKGETTSFASIELRALDDLEHIPEFN
ncbi:MAG: AAA family ATPase [Anaerolineae bacterium]|nr:AAA family ATPase [Anaerolineae bacterium]